MKFLIKLSVFLFSNAVAAQSLLKPFPQHVNYFPGTIKPGNVSQPALDDSVKQFYLHWKERYINDDGGPGQYYVWFENSDGNKQCVSEGQGYGMIITVLMAGYDTAAKAVYEGLYNYYKAHPSKSNANLMSWAQRKDFKDIDGTSAADGDIDIAYSLLLANTQWGSNGKINYLNEAKKMINAIAQQEINPKTYSVILSNAIESDSKDYFDMRSSDFMPANFKAFAKSVNDSTWTNVIDNNYNLFSYLLERYSVDAGLIPDFITDINTNAKPAKAHFLESRYDGCYNYNACRVPWRIATDYILNGDERSKKITEKINQWIRQTTAGNPDNISAGYTLQGDDLKTRHFEAMSFIASFAAAAMIDAKNQEWLNSLWSYMMSFDIDQFDYYDNSIKMLTMIELSGNYWAPSKGAQ